MQLFLKLFGPCLQWFYHCFDRIVINGYISLLTREANIVHFFRDVVGHSVLTKELLRQRTDDYQDWVQRYAQNQCIPIQWAEEDVRKKDFLASRCQAAKNAGRFGVYFIMRSMEKGRAFRVIEPKYPTADPNHRFVRKIWLRYTHFYFYILDPIAGAMCLRIATYMPFTVTGYLNGHEFIERELRRRGVEFKKDDNRFISVQDPGALQKAADGLSGRILQERLDHWAFILGPKFSAKERRCCGRLRRIYSISQIEYCRNFIFKRSWPIHWIFRRSCELGIYLLSGDRITRLFGHPVRRRISGKHQTVVERVDQGQFVFRAYCRNSFLKAYEKAARFLRLEIVCNNLKEFRLRKTLPHFKDVRAKFQEITDRFAQVKAQHLNVHGQLDVLAGLAKTVTQGKTRVAGIKLENRRLMRLLETLMQKASGELRTWTSAALHRIICDQFRLQPSEYTINQLRYDLRKLLVHGLIERIPHSYCYRFTSKGHKIALLMIQLRRRVYGPLGYGLFRHRPSKEHAPDSRFERAYSKVEKAFDDLINLLPTTPTIA